MAHNSTAITRRAAIILGSVAGLAGAASGATSAAAPDLTSKEGRLRAFMRMRGMIDDGLVISFVSGIYYGVVDNTLTPLYGIESVTFGRYRQSSALSYEAVECEEAFYTDLETGKVLDDWRNPYTNEMVKVPEYRSEPKKFKIDENLVFSSAVPGPDVHFEQSVAPPIILGNDIWFTETIAVSGHLPGRTQPLRYQEMKTMHARLGELASVSAKRGVPCDTHVTASVNWAPWQKMGDRPGHLINNADGCYGASMSDLSPVWREATLRSRPELVKDPIVVLDPVWKTLGR